MQSVIRVSVQRNLNHRQVSHGIKKKKKPSQTETTTNNNSVFCRTERLLNTVNATLNQEGMFCLEPQGSGNEGGYHETPDGTKKTNNGKVMVY